IMPRGSFERWHSFVNYCAQHLFDMRNPTHEKYKKKKMAACTGALAIILVYRSYRISKFYRLCSPKFNHRRPHRPYSVLGPGLGDRVDRMCLAPLAAI
ncbi:MAG: hypothetical protein ACK53Y_13730, partial [bacterium]